jgi:hypothetical protein
MSISSNTNDSQDSNKENSPPLSIESEEVVNIQEVPAYVNEIVDHLRKSEVKINIKKKNFF